MDYYPPELPNPVLVMFGGEKSGGGFWGDTWFYNQTVLPNNPWSKCPDANCLSTTNCTNGPSPCNRSGDRVVYYDDGTNKRIFLFGGFRGMQSSEMLGDTWFFQGSSPGDWVPCDATNGCETLLTPASRCCVGLAFDTATDQIVMFGGGFYPKPNAYGDVWLWDLSAIPDAGWVCVSPLPTCHGE